MERSRTQLATKLSHSQGMRIPGFSYPVPPYGGLAFRSFASASSESQFEAFSERLQQCIGRFYLPIYRMADGEFAFLVGWRAPLSNDKIRPLRALRQILGRLRRRVDPRVSPTIWGEAYASGEQSLALQRMEQGVRHVANHGILAIYFTKRADQWGEQYFEPICEWFDSREISVGDDNYVPFYFVYALLNGPVRKRLYAGRHVLVVTHLTEPRKQAIEMGLRQEGVTSVQFLGISSNRALLDQVDVSSVSQPVDLALVAAGIGSVNILQQLEPLSVPCIDSGICLECLIDYKRRFERPFLLDDERLGLSHSNVNLLRFLPSHGAQR
jgi:hypothetical protein